MKISNSLVSGKRLGILCAAGAYTDFAQEHISLTNNAVSEWLEENKGFLGGDQFKPGPFLYCGVEIDGGYENHNFGSHTDDHLEFKLAFPKRRKELMIEDSITGLHVYRMNEELKAVENNHGPNITGYFDSLNIWLSSDGSGWLTKGDFPEALYVKGDEAVHSDMSREAIAGFRLAENWAKYRTIALAGSDFIEKPLRRERRRAGRDYEDAQRMRDLKENACEMYLLLVPSDVPAPARKLYVPGAIEGTLALELEKGINGRMSSRNGPLIQIIPEPLEFGEGDNYSLRANLLLRPRYTFGDASISEEQKLMAKTFRCSLPNVPVEEKAEERRQLEELLGDYFPTEVQEDGSVRITIDISDATEVTEQIIAGSTDTSLHKNAGEVVRVMTVLNDSAKDWYNFDKPLLRQQYEEMIALSRRSRFANAREKLSQR